MPREERRANLRVAIRLPLQIRAGDEGGEFTAATMRNISTRGVNFATRLELKEGQRGMVDVEFEDWTFRARVLVRHAKAVVAGTRVGCEFVDLSSADVERVVDTVFALQREKARLKLSR